MIEEVPGRDVIVGDEWRWSGDRFEVLGFQTIAMPWGHTPRAVLKNVDSGEHSLQDPSKMTIDDGWKLIARKGRTFQ